jgi:osmotically-inducible protein OsmY
MLIAESPDASPEGNNGSEVLLIRKLAPLTLAALLVATACAHRPVQQNRQAFDDADISVRVKTVFLADALDDVAKIDVETSRGVVTLSGRVTTKAEEARAIALARTVKGVVDVKSTLQIE